MGTDRMPKGYGRFQRQILHQLHRTSYPLPTAALLPGRSGFEKRRALRRLAAKGVVHEVRPGRHSSITSRQRATPATISTPAARSGLMHAAWHPTVFVLSIAI